jgi:predicted  nucleic acid-binding Zn-ribbon protein
VNKHLVELIELSKIDKSVDSFIPQIESAQNKIEKEQNKADVIVEKIDTLNSRIGENSDKIASYEEQITALSEQLKSIQKKNKAITNEKEMKALSVEEELAKEKLSFANDEIDRLEKVNESKKGALEEASEKLAEVEILVAEVNTASGKILADVEKKRMELYKERAAKVDTTDQKILSFYEKVRRWAGNTAVVPVKKQACYGCYMKLNEKTYSEVIKAEEIVNCPHCGRILYIDNSAPEEE